MAAIIAQATLRKLMALLFAVALVVAPTAAYRANAAPGPTHEMTMMDGGHCSELPAQSGDRGKIPAKNCCVSMCQAIAAVPTIPFIVEPAERVPPGFATSETHDGCLGDIATPPPRHA